MAMGALNPSDTPLQMTLTDNAGSDINIQTPDIESEDNNSDGGRLKAVYLDRSNPTRSGNQNGGRWNISPFTGNIIFRSVIKRNLIFDFAPYPAPGLGTPFYVFLDIGCQFPGSN